jgi:sporulation integral membrane protein YtvI
MQPYFSPAKEEFSLRSGTKKSLALLAVFFTAWLSARYLLPLLAPFLLGTVLALTAEPVAAFLTRHLRLPRPVSSALGVTMAFCFFTVSLLLAGAVLLRELRGLAGVLPDLEQTAATGLSTVRNWTMTLAARTPAGIRPYVRENVDTFFSDGTAMLGKVTGMALSSAGNLLTHVPDSALTLGTGILSAFLISAKLPRIRRWLLRRIPKERLRSILAAGKRMKKALAGWLLAQLKLMTVTLLILLLGFSLLRIPRGTLWALGVTLVDTFPILGTGTVLLPWSLLCFLQNNAPRAIGLLGLYATVTLTRSILEPKLVGHHLGLDPLATLAALYVGYRLWGIAGMILAPLLAVTALQLVPDRPGSHQ